MAKMNDYPSVENTEEFTQEQKAAFLGSAMCIATGSKTVGGNKVTANIPLSDITPEVPVADGTTISNTSGTLSVAIPVPAPVASTDQGKVLTVDNSDNIVWSTPAGGLPAYTSTEAGKVLAVNSQGDGVEWIAAGGGSSTQWVILSCYQGTITSSNMAPTQALAIFQNDNDMACRVNYVDGQGGVTGKREYPVYQYNGVGIMFTYGTEGSGGDGNFKGVFGDTDNEIWMISV